MKLVEGDAGDLDASSNRAIVKSNLDDLGLRGDERAVEADICGDEA